MKLKAKIQLTPTEKGGREKPIDVYYKPSFSIGNGITDCQVMLLGKQRLAPGGSSEVEITIPGKPRLRKDMEFDLIEGMRKVATGRIERIIA